MLGHILMVLAKCDSLPRFNTSSFPINKKLCRGGSSTAREWVLAQDSHALVWPADKEGPSRECQSQAEVAGGVESCGGQGAAGCCSERIAASGGSRRLHSGIRKANNGSANARTIQRVFLQRKSYSTANVCSGSGQREQKQGAQDEEGQKHSRKKGWEKKTACLERKAQEDT